MKFRGFDPYMVIVDTKIKSVVNRIAVHYYAQSKITDYKIVFITVIPTYAYNEPSIQQCILNKVTLFDSILSHLDYTVSFSIRHI